VNLKIIMFAVILIISGCTKYDQLNTSGISNYDTVRLYPIEDSLEYPFWKEVIIYYDLDSQRVERTFFLIKWTAYGKTDTDIVFIKKDTIKTKEK